MIQSISAGYLQQIISYLEDDNKSLHSCLLMNRFWCYNTVNALFGGNKSDSNLCGSEIHLYNNRITRKKSQVYFYYFSFQRSLDYDYMYWSIS